jgi:hypothetical protein
VLVPGLVAPKCAPAFRRKVTGEVQVMNRSRFRGSLIAFTALLGLALTPGLAFAQHGGGGGHSGGGGGGFHGGGGSYGGGGFHGGSYGGSGVRGNEGGFHGNEGGSRGGYEGGSRGGYSRGGGTEAGRSLSSEGSRSSNLRPAINDGQWHSFGNAGAGHASAATSASGTHASTSGANSNLMAHNAGTTGGAWHSFAGSRSEAGFVGGSRGGVSEFNHGYGYGWHGGYGGYYGWHGGWGCCGWGWGGLGFGWGFWGFGFGWPYWGWGGFWGPAWAAWNPYWYNPYWYPPLAYSYGYPDYSLDWSNNPPPYRPDAAPSAQGSEQQDSADDWIAPSSDNSLVPDSSM